MRYLPSEVDDYVIQRLAEVARLQRGCTNDRVSPLSRNRNTATALLLLGFRAAPTATRSATGPQRVPIRQRRWRLTEPLRASLMWGTGQEHQRRRMLPLYAARSEDLGLGRLGEGQLHRLPSCRAVDARGAVEARAQRFRRTKTPFDARSLRRQGVGWVIIHWFELGTLALLCLNLWFVSTVLNALRETNRWLAFLTRVRWDETDGPESPPSPP